MSQQDPSNSPGEEIKVIFHAALLGRTDVIKNAISSMRTEKKLEEDDIINVLSSIRGEDGATPLHVASQQGHNDVIRALLNAGVDLTIMPISGELAYKTAYDLASDATKQIFHVYLFEQIAMGNVNAIGRLINGGISVDVLDGFPLSESTLHWGASFNCNDIVIELLCNGATINLLNAKKQSSLHIACKNGNFELIKILLDEGADTTLTDIDGKLPLDLIPSKLEEKEEYVDIKNLLLSPPEPSMSLFNLFTERDKLRTEELLKLQEEQLKKNEESDINTNTFENPDSNNSNINKEDITVNTIENNESENCFTDPTLQLENIFSGSESSDNNNNNNSVETKSPLLIFWPQVKQQKRDTYSPPMEISSAENILVCVSSSEIDIFPLLSWSGLVEVMDVFGFQLQVKRSTLGAKLRLCIDPNICPCRHSYELQVRSDQIIIIASDSAGLLYGVYTLIQILQLHSEVSTQVNPDNNNNIHTVVKIPVITITDWPDVKNRSVLWSYRVNACTSFPRMKEQIVMFSKVRVNMLFLQVDTVNNNNNDNNNTTNNESCSNEDEKKILMDLEDVSAGIYALNEMCKVHCIEMVPSIVISSIYQSCPLNILKNFSHPMISVVIMFDYKSIFNELTNNNNNTNTNDLVISKDLVATYCRDACNNIMKQIQQAGFSSVILSCSEFSKQVADPMSIALSYGLIPTEKDLNLMCPSSLFCKPLLCVQSFVQSLHIYSNFAAASGSLFSVLPAFADADFICPALLSKFYCLLHGGICWNKAAFLDMLGDPSESYFDVTIISEVLMLLLFSSCVQTDDIPKELLKSVINLLTGELVVSEMYSPDSNQSFIFKNSTNNTDNQASNDENMSLSDLYTAEKLLWSLLNMSDHKLIHAIPSKNEASMCLKLLRRVLHSSSWKSNMMEKRNNINILKNENILDFSMSSKREDNGQCNSNSNNNIKLSVDNTKVETFLIDEIDELFAVINMFSVQCRAIVFGYNSYKRNANNIDKAISYQDLFESLPVGTKSDIANSLLESLASCSIAWHKRFDHRLIESFKSMSILRNQNNSLLNIIAVEKNSLNDKISIENNNISISPDLFIDASLVRAKLRYLLQSYPSIPAAAIFKALSEKLPLPKSVEEFIGRLFVK